jgi:hypothetical protein
MDAIEEQVAQEEGTLGYPVTLTVEVDLREVLKLAAGLINI